LAKAYHLTNFKVIKWETLCQWFLYQSTTVARSTIIIIIYPLVITLAIAVVIIITTIESIKSLTIIRYFLIKFFTYGRRWRSEHDRYWCEFSWLILSLHARLIIKRRGAVALVTRYRDFSTKEYFDYYNSIKPHNPRLPKPTY